MAYTRKMPEGFEKDARGGATRKELMERYRAGAETISRWLGELEIFRGRGKHKRPVAKYDPATGELLNIYPSMVEAAIHTYGCSQAICRCCKGKIRTAYGFRWEYYEGQESRTV